VRWEIRTLPLVPPHSFCGSWNTMMHHISQITISNEKGKKIKHPLRLSLKRSKQPGETRSYEGPVPPTVGSPMQPYRISDTYPSAKSERVCTKWLFYMPSLRAYCFLPRDGTMLIPLALIPTPQARQ